ncbi:MAG: hypothetical protein N2049_00570 [Anaerolineales bacterium]|nr:hypothetical protein [Anaerolineales bacterium]MCX7607698.1 hypothetical protein [Anaerolineales bacterium]MDW8227147.1 hypothetical protein [Anaerolineales bacterium]
MKQPVAFILWRLASWLVALPLLLAACAPQATPTPTPEPTSPPEPTVPPAVPTVIQDFESGAQPYDAYNAKASIGDVAYSGKASLKSESTEGEWHTVGVNLSSGPVDLTPYNRLCFWVYDTTTHNNGMAANTVGVRLIDANGNQVERWTDNEGVGANVKTRLNEWVPMCLNLITFTGIDQSKVEKIEFTMYWPGVYYFDDITLLPASAEAPKPGTGAGNKVFVVTLQGFEQEDTYYSDYQAEVSLSNEVVHSGNSSLKMFYESGEWHAFGGYPNPKPVDLSKFDKLCFWIYDTTTNNDGKADNTVGVRLFDSSGANQEIWTDHELAGQNPKTVTNQWVQMCINLAAYTDINLTQIEKIQFAVYWAGTYYVDDIQAYGTVEAASEPIVVQDFESEGENFYSDYQAELSISTEVVHSGKAALKMFYESGEWHAFGAFFNPRPFNALPYSKVCFWIMDTTTNNNGKADNTVGVRLIDSSGRNPEVWTDHAAAGENPKTVTNEWVKMCINLNAYEGVDLSQLEKIQFALYWAGTYYVDDITFEP